MNEIRTKRSPSSSLHEYIVSWSHWKTGSNSVTGYLLRSPLYTFIVSDFFSDFAFLFVMYVCTYLFYLFIFNLFRIVRKDWKNLSTQQGTCGKNPKTSVRFTMIWRRCKFLILSCITCYLFIFTLPLVSISWNYSVCLLIVTWGQRFFFYCIVLNWIEVFNTFLL